jgi:hypothetical protein
MKKILIAVVLTLSAMSASAVQCIVNMKSGKSYERNQTNCVTTQYAGALPIAKQLKNVAIVVGVAYLITRMVDTKTADSLKNSFTGEDEGPIEYVPFEGQPVVEVASKVPTCSPGLWGRYENNRWVCN